MFTALHDEIFIKKIKSDNHNISFFGKFSPGINMNNTVSKLLSILENKELLKDKKFRIKINKKIPTEAGLGGGSMNAANILKYLIKKKIVKASKKEISEICKLIGSDVILGLKSVNSILTSKDEIKYFKNTQKFYILIIKPNFGCNTKKIYSYVNKFNKPRLTQPNKKMFETKFLIKNYNFLELFAFSRYPKLKILKIYLEKELRPTFVRMTGSGSAIVAYYKSKKKCENAKKKFIKKYKNFWCMASKTI
tara:strand:+ start:232 stop:981 length:750 start_codon:yes stop_codon:yes gene_type:complete